MFEKVNIQDLKFNPFDEISNHWVLISAKKDGVVNTMTASWGQLGHLWGKNVMTVYIRPQRYTKEFVDTGDYFTVTLNVLDTPLHVTVILAVPFLIPFTVPLEDTVAIFLLLDLYVIFPDGVAFAAILVVFPTFTDADVFASFRVGF